MSISSRRLRSLFLLAAFASVVALGGCDALRVLFPSNVHETEPPEIPPSLSRPAILLFTKTNGFRHSDAIEVGVPALEEIARRNGWAVFHTENGAIHTQEALDRFDVVVWHQVSGNVLSKSQRNALEAWIREGGRFFGIHGTGGDPEYDWEWHPEALIGAQFTGHPMNPQFQEARVVIEAVEHPAMSRLPREWVRTDEWYSFEESPRRPGVEILATLDESTYEPTFDVFGISLLGMERDLRMGEDHPIIWTHCIGDGRSLYSALGHQAEAYSEREHLDLLEDALRWLMTERLSGAACRVPAS